ncbi:MAG: type II toxin-antitoxin system Phd/YefM family antitoxin [Cytophagales bacterium]|nr:type II toxin-antitoxin system Phd/YefM family antitoxin [Cytophagales bacterium]
MYDCYVTFSIFVPYWYTKCKIMLVISSREFRQNQKKYFERVDKGEHIIVQRAKDKAYALTPISEDDMYFNGEMVNKIKQSILEVQQGEVQRISTSKEISDLLGL